MRLGSLGALIQFSDGYLSAMDTCLESMTGTTSVSLGKQQQFQKMDAPGRVGFLDHY